MMSSYKARYNITPTTKTKYNYLSTAMAARVFTEAHTDTPCKNGVTLHITGPNGQPEIKNIVNVEFTYKQP